MRDPDRVGVGAFLLIRVVVPEEDTEFVSRAEEDTFRTIVVGARTLLLKEAVERAKRNFGSGVFDAAVASEEVFSKEETFFGDLFGEGSSVPNFSASPR